MWIEPKLVAAPEWRILKTGLRSRDNRLCGWIKTIKKISLVHIYPRPIDKVALLFILAGSNSFDSSGVLSSRSAVFYSSTTFCRLFYIFSWIVSIFQGRISSLLWLAGWLSFVILNGLRNSTFVTTTTKTTKTCCFSVYSVVTRALLVANETVTTLN